MAIACRLVFVPYPSGATYLQFIAVCGMVITTTEITITILNSHPPLPCPAPQWLWDLVTGNAPVNEYSILGFWCLMIAYIYTFCGVSLMMTQLYLLYSLKNSNNGARESNAVFDSYKLELHP